MITIILTSTVHVTSNTAFQVDKQDRINCYVKSVKSWLNNTKFNIVLVENSGYSFPELSNELDKFSGRFEIISFINDFPDSLKFLGSSKGGLELFSIHYAFEKSHRIRHSLYIIKITGRYFVPGLEKYLSTLNLHAVTALAQHNEGRCELVGSHILHFSNIFDMKKLNTNCADFDPHIENVYDYRFSITKNIVRCPVFNIEPTQQGGLNNIVCSL